MAAVVPLAGCGGAPTERAITTEEADRIAETLFNNWDLGGATFALAVLAQDGNTLNLSGQVDFKQNVGRASVSNSAGTYPITEVVWTSSVVLENRPEFTAMAAAAGEGDFTFVARNPDTANIELDSLLAVVVGLGSSRRDNPILIAQDPQNRWLRTDAVDGVAVDVFAVGERTRLWIEQGTSRLVRFESDNAARTRPIVVDLRAQGPVEILAPDPATVADSAAMPEIYTAAGGVLPQSAASPSPQG